MSKTIERSAVLLKEQEKEKTTKGWNFVPLALMWVVWRERNRRAFEGV